MSAVKGPQAERIIRFDKVTFTYPGGTEPAVENLSFSVKKGSRVLILGSNGSGKSTAARLITGLLRPDKGSVTTLGLSTEDKNNYRSIRSRAGLLFQNPSSQIVATVVREDTAFGPENLALSHGEIRRRVEDALNKTRLHPLRRRATEDLSAGQQQRLALAGVLALGAGCLILDEAASMLNPAARREMDTLLEDLHAKGATILQVSHFMDRIARADQILIFHRGRLMMDGSPEEFLERASSLEEWSLKVPDIRILSAALGKILPDIRTVLREETLAEDLKKALSLRGPGQKETFRCNEEEQTPGNSPPLLSLREVSYHYNPGTSHTVPGLCRMDFDFYQGETAVLMGATGSGKSTLLQILNSLLLPTSGTVSLLGEDPLNRECDLARLRTRIGLVMQQPEKQLFAPLVGDDVAFGPRQMGVQGRELSLRVKEALDLMKLPYNQFRDRSIRALSGGQKRKVALAGVLAMRPEILLLDEPTAGLDPGAAEDLEGLLFQLRREGIHLILTTHDVEQAVRFDPRFMVLSGGRKVFDGTPGTFFRDHEPADFGLEYPLVLRVWRNAVPRDDDVLPLTGGQLLGQAELFSARKLAGEVSG